MEKKETIIEIIQISFGVLIAICKKRIQRKKIINSRLIPNETRLNSKLNLD